MAVSEFTTHNHLIIKMAMEFNKTLIKEITTNNSKPSSWCSFVLGKSKSLQLTIPVWVWSLSLRRSRSTEFLFRSKYQRLQFMLECINIFVLNLWNRNLSSSFPQSAPHIQILARVCHPSLDPQFKIYSSKMTKEWGLHSSLL